jgi:hypothetical protein
MNPMVQRVARAICATDNRLAPDGVASRLYDEEEPAVQARYIERAHAAIAAMREPTDKMEVAGKVAFEIGGDDRFMHDCYCAMIDAALEEK